MKEQILLFNMLFVPFKSHVGFQSYRQFYFASLRYKTIKKNIENRAPQFFMFLIVFHPAIFNISNSKSPLRGRVNNSLQPSFFSSHGCIYTKMAVSTSSMILCLSCHVT